MAESTPIARFSALVEAAVGVVEETDLERVLRRLVTEARSATGARYAALGVIGEHGTLTDFLYEGLTTQEAEFIGNLPSGRGVLGAVVRENGTIRLDVIGDHPDSVGFPEHHPPMDGFLGVPVSVGGVAFGSLYLTDKPGGFTDQDEHVVLALSRIAGAAVHTDRLQRRLRKLAVVEDRQRIARELHDSVIQEMFAVGLSLQSLSHVVENPHVEARLLDAVDQLDHSVEALRRHIFELRHENLVTTTASDDLQELVDRMGSAYPANVGIDIEADDDYLSSLGEDLPMIVTEALSNALRHSGAATVRIQIATSDAECSIRVIDDGAGFDVTRPTKGMGLENLKTRVGLLGGKVTIASSSEGTEFVASLPVA
jgi:signal transduction histidine kinase